jgi:citrate synthase
MKNSHGKVRKRDEDFSQRIVTKIWQEDASENNPYIAENCRCHGYDLLELMQQRSFVDVLYLLFRGELPTKIQAQMLESLMIALINPGPRHPATRAGMCAGAGNTETQNILPISLTILGGNHLGAGEIEETMRFFRKEKKKDPFEVADALISQATPPKEGDWHIIPGFGNRFGGIDSLPQKIARYLVRLPGSGKALEWGCTFAEALHPCGLGWLSTGLAAAVFTDLGFHSRMGSGLFQLISAPGLLAHGLELANKPITAMPFIKDEDYTIES